MAKKAKAEQSAGRKKQTAPKQKEQNQNKKKTTAAKQTAANKKQPVKKQESAKKKQTAVNKKQSAAVRYFTVQFQHKITAFISAFFNDQGIFRKLFNGIGRIDHES